MLSKIETREIISYYNENCKFECITIRLNKATDEFNSTITLKVNYLKSENVQI